MGVKDILAAPQLYQWFQEAGGFFGARVKAIEQHLGLTSGMRILDIGCGPGHIVKYLPAGVRYSGFDIDPNYIEFAKRNFGDKGDFHCRFFDEAAAKEFAGADVVMMNGVMHHIPDAELIQTLRNVKAALKDGGRLFTLDGVFLPEQSAFVRRMLENDRGRFVRTPEAYEAVLKSVFSTIEPHIHTDLSRVPYSFYVAISS